MAQAKSKSRLTSRMASVVSLPINVLDLDATQLIGNVVIFYHVDQSICCTCIHESTVGDILADNHSLSLYVCVQIIVLCLTCSSVVRPSQLNPVAGASG